MGGFRLNKNALDKLNNLFMRGISMGSKFLFTIFVSKYMAVGAYGELNLLITSITILIFILGMDLYSYTAREILSISGHQRFKFIKSQFFFHILIYVLAAPVIFLFCKTFLSVSLFIFFYVLLVFEHFSQELYRIFIFHNKQFTANWLLFLRTFLWIVFICFDVLILQTHSFTTEIIVLYWTFGSFVSFITGMILLRKEYPIGMARLFSLNDLDIGIVKKGLRICVPIFIGTISYKLIEYSDRYIIDWLLGKEQVGIYSLYSNYSNIVNIVVNTVVTLMIFPKLVESAKLKNYEVFNKQKKIFKKELLVVTSGMSLILLLSIYPVLTWIGNEQYSEFILGFFFLLAGNVFLNLSFFPHYLLYSFNRDRSNIYPAIFAMIINIVLNVVLIGLFRDLIWAAVTTAISFLLIFILKTLNWHNFNKGLILESEKQPS